MDNELIKAIGKSLVIMWNCNPNFRQSFEYESELDTNTFNYLNDLMIDLTDSLSDEINKEVKERHYNFSYEEEPFQL